MNHQHTNQYSKRRPSPYSLMIGKLSTIHPMFLASKDTQVPLSASFVQSRRQQRRKRTFLIIQTVTVNLKITFVTLPVGCCLAYFLFCDRDADSSAKFPFVGTLPHNVDSPAAQLQGPLNYDCCVRFSEIRFMKEEKTLPH